MEFPGFLNTYGAETRIIKHLGMHNERLLNCNATVWFDVPKFTLGKRYRVWQIACDNKQAGATYSELVAESSMSLTLSAVFAFFIMPLGMAIWAIQFLRKCHDR